MAKAVVYLVGAGPGDPGLVTVKGLDLIKKADVIIYDSLANQALLNFARPEAKLINVGKRGGEESTSQAQINRLLITSAKKGKVVVRLKGGDPFIFGRGAEEAEALWRAGVSFEVVPGVTSAIAAPAYAGIPLTDRRFTSTVTLVTGHEDPKKQVSHIPWERLATGCGTLAFLMGVGNLKTIADRLMENGRDPKTPVALVRWGTLPRQETLVATLETVSEEARRRKFRPPAIIVVGEVVSLRESLNWYETKPLFGKRVLVTRTRSQASALSVLLADAGAEPIEVPTIAIAPPLSFKKLDRAISDLTDFDWIIFTSANGVDHFFDRLTALGGDVRRLAHAKLCAIGPATAEALKIRGLSAQVVPEEFISEGIVTVLSKMVTRGSRILIPRAEKARDLLPEGLSRLGARVTVAVAYRTTVPRDGAGKLLKLLAGREIDIVTFTSSSTVRNLASLVGRSRLPKVLAGVLVAAIGPITARTAEEYGLKCPVVAAEHTIPGLVRALTEHFYAGADRRQRR